jgi:hypothetical protein
MHKMPLIKYYHLMSKALKKLGIEGMYLNIIKAIYNKPIVNNTKLEKLKLLLLNSGM